MPVEALRRTTEMADNEDSAGENCESGDFLLVDAPEPKCFSTPIPTIVFLVSCWQLVA